MSVTSTNSVTSGSLKEKEIQLESKKVFLDTAKTKAIRKGSIVSVPEVLGGKPLEGGSRRCYHAPCYIWQDVQSYSDRQGITIIPRRLELN